MLVALRLEKPAWDGQATLSFDADGEAVLGGPLNEFAAAAMRADAIDPLVTELVRLRCAGVRDCRACGSLRMADALAAGLEDDAAQKVAAYRQSDLKAAAVAALRLADAIILTAGQVDADLA